MTLEQFILAYLKNNNLSIREFAEKADLMSLSAESLTQYAGLSAGCLYSGKDRKSYGRKCALSVEDGLLRTLH